MKQQKREAWFRERFQAMRERVAQTLVIEVEHAKPPAPGYLVYATEGSLGASSALEAFGFRRIEEGDDEFPGATYRRYVRARGDLHRLKRNLEFALPGWRVVFTGPASVEVLERAA